jgi:hypothetical protein
MPSVDILFFSRGRGKGHAVPDLAITAELRSILPSVRVLFASYASGAEVFRAAGEEFIDLGFSETTSLFDIVIGSGRLLTKQRTRVVCSHEEPGVLLASKVFECPSVFLTHWFPTLQDPYLDVFKCADEVLFMEQKRLFPEPAQLSGKVRYIGPVLRRFKYRPCDRSLVRSQLGLRSGEALILVAPGSPSESLFPIYDLIMGAFKEVDCAHKRLIWVAGRDYLDISKRAEESAHCHVVDTDWQLDRLMVASDVAITRGTYNIGKELMALGIPSIALSHGHNFIDDMYSRCFPSNTFLWAQETTCSALARRIEELLHRGLAAPDVDALQGHGARCVAEHLATSVRTARSKRS